MVLLRDSRFSLWAKRLTVFLTVIAIIAIGNSISQFVWLVVDGKSSFGNQNKSIRTVKAFSTSDSQGVDQIIGMNLFGELNISEQEDSFDQLNAPETKLSLELKGVFNANEKQNSYAVIARRGGEEELYKIGDNLPGNARLVAISSDRIILKRSGAFETLTLIDQLGSDVIKISANLENNSTTPRSRGVGGFVENFKRKIKQNPQKAIKDLGLQEVSKNQASGYRVGDKFDNNKLAKLGLRQDDIILAVNGKNLGQINQDQNLFDQVAAKGKARVKVQRGNENFFVTLNLR